MNDKQLTQHFKLSEFLRSSTADKLGIDNKKGFDEKSLLEVAKLLEKIREKAGFPIWISSGYRCDAVNTAVGGSPKSQHRLSQAADIKACKGHTNKELFEIIKTMIADKEITCGQLIDEYNYSWIHVSIPANRKKINQILHLK